MAVYYNDADPAACAWLRELIAAGLLPDGEVDERSILDVEPADLRGFAQCHSSPESAAGRTRCHSRA